MTANLRPRNEREREREREDQENEKSKEIKNGNSPSITKAFLIYSPH